MLTIENKDREIFVFGRDKNLKPYIKKDNLFYPYFYYEHKDGKYTTLDGTKVKKKIIDSPSSIMKERQLYNHYEGDIHYTNRYLLDKYKTIEKEPIRIWYIDIEITTKGGFPDIKKAENEILSICLYDTFEEKYYCYAELDTNDEKKLLQDFIKNIQLKDPDMLIAWNGDGFDFPYLINRINRVGLNAKDLSRIGVTVGKERGSIIKGRVLFDLMWAYKTLAQGQGRESWSLEYISQYELGEGKEEYDGSLETLWKTDKEKFLKYNKRDVELLKLLNEKLHIVEFFDEIRRYVGCKFEDVFMNSRIVDMLILRFCKEKNIVLPSKKHNERDSYEGAFVYQPTKGLYKNVACADLNSLYPSIIVGLNLSPETFMNKTTHRGINIQDKYFFKGKHEKVGIIPEIVEGLIQERKKFKKLRDEQKYGSIEYKSYETIEQAVKVITNSIYGVLGSPKFRLYKREIADTITLVGRGIITFSIEYLNKKGFSVIYGDTDSVFFKTGSKTVDQIKEIIENLNTEYETFAKQFGAEDHRFNIECEKIFKTIFFTNAKKRYAGKLRWYKGKEVDSLLIAGFESNRSDSPQVIRDFQKELFRLILEGKGKEIVEGYVERTREKMKQMKEELGIPVGLQKHFKEYKNHPIHVRAAQHSNKYHGTNFKKGDKIKWVYIKSVPQNVPHIEVNFTTIPFTNVVAFEKKIPDGYVIDYEKMRERLIESKVKEVFNGLGWVEESGDLSRWSI